MLSKITYVSEPKHDINEAKQSSKKKRVLVAIPSEEEPEKDCI